MEPLVSIGIPVKNGFLNKSDNDINLEKALNSIINQNYQNLEIIISNNCSSDRTKNYLEKVARLDNRIKLFNQKTEISWAENFKFVLNQSTGKYFKWNAADDLISNDYIKNNVYFLEKNLDYINSSSNFYYENDLNKVYSFNLDENLYKRIKYFFQIKDISHNIFFSLIRKNIIYKTIDISKDYLAIDWIFDLDLLLNGKFKSLDKGYIIFGIKGASRQENFINRSPYNKKIIYRIFPFYELMKNLFKKTIFSKELSSLEKFSIYIKCFKINLQFIKKHKLNIIKKILNN